MMLLRRSFAPEETKNMKGKAWRQAVGGFGVLVSWLILALPLVGAVTAPTADGETHVTDSACTINLGVPADQTIRLDSDPDDFVMPMDVAWDDDRTPGPTTPRIVHVFSISASYFGTIYPASYTSPETDGGNDNGFDSFSRTIDSVSPSDDNTIVVVYSVVVRLAASPFTVLCSADNSSEPELTTFTITYP